MGSTPTARAAQATVNRFAWTDANPMLNLSSFVTTFAEPEAVEVARSHMYKNYIDHDMYPQVFKMEGQMVKCYTTFGMGQRVWSRTVRNDRLV